MDPTSVGWPDFVKDVVVEDDHNVSPNSDQYPPLLNKYRFNLPTPNLNFLESSRLSPDPGHADLAPPVVLAPAVEPYAQFGGDSSEPSRGTIPEGVLSSDDIEFSETVLKYISEMLMEENVENKNSILYDPLSHLEIVLCAQAVSTGDNRTANGLLKQIRQHSSPCGDGSQRLAHYFANALEARMAGTRTSPQTYFCFLFSNRVSAFQVLKAHTAHLSILPFWRFSPCFASQMIYNVAGRATSLHIIDFGIQYGFHWPILIKKLSERAGGPPRLRITGIEFPQPGLYPTERMEETGRQLTRYCEQFNVPFVFHSLVSKNWETIQIEDLKIDRYEVLAVNCFNRFKNLLGETVEKTSPRDGVSKLIRSINPDIFVTGLLNGAHDAPFFVTRFREALFHFSAFYSILDATLPRNNMERLMYEREFYGREVMNVIAYEGLERIERPETYKHWHIRSVRAGFKPLPLDQEVLTMFRSKLKEWYHRDFFIDEDNHWMLQGWRGRILFASSCWVPS